MRIFTHAGNFLVTRFRNIKIFQLAVCAMLLLGVILNRAYLRRRQQNADVVDSSASHVRNENTLRSHIQEAPNLDHFSKNLREAELHEEDNHSNSSESKMIHEGTESAQDGRKAENAVEDYIPSVANFQDSAEYQEAFVRGGHLKDDLVKFLTPVEDIDQSPEAIQRDKMLLDFHNNIRDSPKIQKATLDILESGHKKCGTTWLQFLLKWHPLVNTAPVLTNSPDEPGLEWYRSPPKVNQYQKLSGQLQGYRRVFNTTEDWDALPRLPNVRICTVLCEPARRAFSDFVYMSTVKTQRAIERYSTLPKTFDEFINVNLARTKQIIGDPILNITALWEMTDKLVRQDATSLIFILGLEILLTDRLIQLASRERVCIINGDEMVKNAGKEFEKLQECLGLPRLVLAEDFVKDPSNGFFCLRPTVVHQSRLYKLPLQCLLDKNKGVTRSSNAERRPSEHSLQTLRDFYRPYDEKLFEFIGQRLW